MNEKNKTYFGKYRATVMNNLDPDQRGRLMLTVPDVLGLIPSTWAEPCVPLAGPTGPPMGVFFVPPISAGVWAEFEHGDPNRPIWSGCRWGSQSDVPPAANAGLPAAPNIVIQSLTQNKIIISSVPGEAIVIETTAGSLGPRFEMTATGLKLTCGPLTSIELSPTDVKINGQALVVQSA